MKNEVWDAGRILTPEEKAEISQASIERWMDYVKEQLNETMEETKMVDVSKAMESSYLDVELVRESPTKKCVFLDEGEYVSKEYQGERYEKLEFLVEIDGKRKKWAPNKDTITNISNAFGKNSQSWIGRVVKLSIGTIKGRSVVYGMPIEA